MNSKKRKIRSKPAIFVFLFTIATIAIFYFLFSDVIQCMQDWGGFSDDCRHTFFLTLFFPAPFFFLIWLLILIIAIVKFKKKKN